MLPAVCKYLPNTKSHVHKTLNPFRNLRDNVFQVNECIDNDLVSHDFVSYFSGSEEETGWQHVFQKLYSGELEVCL